MPQHHQFRQLPRLAVHSTGFGSKWVESAKILKSQGLRHSKLWWLWTLLDHLQGQSQIIPKVTDKTPGSDEAASSYLVVLSELRSCQHHEASRRVKKQFTARALSCLLFHDLHLNACSVNPQIGGRLRHIRRLWCLCFRLGPICPTFNRIRMHRMRAHSLLQSATCPQSVTAHLRHEKRTSFGIRSAPDLARPAAQPAQPQRSPATLCNDTLYQIELQSVGCQNICCIDYVSHTVACKGQCERIDN